MDRSVHFVTCSWAKEWIVCTFCDLFMGKGMDRSVHFVTGSWAEAFDAGVHYTTTTKENHKIILKKTCLPKHY